LPKVRTSAFEETLHPCPKIVRIGQTPSTITVDVCYGQPHS